MNRRQKIPRSQVPLTSNFDYLTAFGTKPKNVSWFKVAHLCDRRLTKCLEMSTVVRMMRFENSGLDIRDRQWLKITIPCAFIGSELVDWLHSKVEGLQDRRDARRYATSLLKANYIKHTVNKTTFSEQCYYVFGDQKNVPSLPKGECLNYLFQK